MAVRSVALSADGRKCAWASSDGVVRQWDVGATKWASEAFTMGVMAPAAVRYSWDSKQIALAADKTPVVGMLSAEDLECVDKYSFKGHSKTLQTFEFIGNRGPPDSGSSEDVALYAVTGDTSLRLWNGETNTCVQSFQGHETQVLCTRIWDNGGRLLSGSYDGEVRLWDVNSGEPILQVEGHRDGAMQLSLAPDEKRFAVASGDGHVAVWDVTSGRRIARSRPHGDGPAYCVLFDSRGLWVASGGRDGKIVISDSTRRMRRYSELLGHTSSVLDIAWSRDRRLLVSGGRDNTARLWGMTEGDTSVIVLDNAEDKRQVRKVHVTAPRRQDAQSAARPHAADHAALDMVASHGHPRYAVQSDVNQALAEDQRIEAQQRIRAEELRIQAEQLRLQAEEQRIRAEEQRIRAEEQQKLLADEKRTEDAASPRDPIPSPELVRIRLDRLTFIRHQDELIGESPAGLLYRGIYDGENIGVKVIGQPLLPHAKEAAPALSALRHSNVVHFLGIADDASEEVVVITEFVAAGSVRQSALGDVEVETKLAVASQIARGLAYVHERELPHGSVSLDNVLLTDPAESWRPSSRAKLADACFHLLVDSARSHPRAYWAPEQFGGATGGASGLYSTAADVYALGVVLWELFTGESAWHGVADAQIQELVVGGKRHPGAIPDEMPDVLKEAILGCWHSDPTKRLEANEVINYLSRIPTAPPIPEEEWLELLKSEADGQLQIA